jgi:hypothetical protein
MLTAPTFPSILLCNRLREKERPNGLIGTLANRGKLPRFLDWD